ncbi:MAG: hypothetical protein FWE19_00315 [Oscillospiraceae bacterium]|nr:hypothetical protein [Oscillospiraceae bacterium]
MFRKKSHRGDQLKLEPPKLPFQLLFVTFAAPVGLIIFRAIFTSDEIAWSTLIIIALSVLVVMLVVLCIVIMLNAYDDAFSRQIQKIHAAAESERMHEAIVNSSFQLEQVVVVMEKNEIEVPHYLRELCIKNKDLIERNRKWLDARYS